MKRTGTFAALAALLLPMLLGTTSLIVRAGTPPSLPPCTADGACYPSYPWGRTPTKWRKWPGVDAPTLATPTTDEFGNPIPPTQLPPAETEDTEAPPMIDAIEPPSESTGGAGGLVLPPMETPRPEEGPPRPPAGGGLPFPVPGEEPPAGPAGGADLPPGLPFDVPGPAAPNGAPQPAGPAGGGNPQPLPFQFNQNLPGVHRENAPPELPVAFRNASASQPTVAALRPAPVVGPAPVVAVGPGVDRNVRPAAVDASNLPPELPAIFFEEVK